MFGRGQGVYVHFSIAYFIINNYILYIKALGVNRELPCIFQRHNISSDGSAFEQVPHLQVPRALSWGSNMARQEVNEPPKVSVTAPAEETQTTRISESTISSPASQGVVGPVGSSRNSPNDEMENSNEEMFHKKFDKFRKPVATHSAMDETRKMENLTINDMEAMESEDMYDDSERSEKDKSPNGERAKMSATEAHPQLLAQLKSGPQFKPLIHPAFPTGTAGPAFIPHHQLQQNGSNIGSVGLAGVSPNVKKTGSLSPNNVVLSVPQTPFGGNRSPNVSPTAGSTSGQSLMNNHPCLQNILNRRDNAPMPTVTSQFLGVDTNKDAIPRKIPSSENLVKTENDPSPPPNFRNGHAHHPPMFGGFPPRPTGYDPAQYMLYQQMYLQQQQQQGIRVPQYNEHLAGMQQMVYGGNPQQMRR